MTLKRRRDWSDTCVRWENELAELSTHGRAMHHLHKEAHTLVRTLQCVCAPPQNTQDWLCLRPQSLSLPLAVNFLFRPVSISCFPRLSSFLHGLARLQSPPLHLILLFLLLLHFASDKGSGLCADCGWLEHCAVQRRCRNLSPRALNVPLEEQFLWGGNHAVGQCQRIQSGGSLRVQRREWERELGWRGKFAHYYKYDNVAVLVVELVLVHDHKLYRFGLKSDHIPLLYVIVFFLLHHCYLSPSLCCQLASRAGRKNEKDIS